MGPARRPAPAPLRPPGGWGAASAGTVPARRGRAAALPTAGAAARERRGPWPAAPGGRGGRPRGEAAQRRPRLGAELTEEGGGLELRKFRV